MYLYYASLNKSIAGDHRHLQRPQCTGAIAHFGTRMGLVHALPKILDGLMVFLSFDTPRRDPKDIIFVNPEDGTPETSVRGKEL